VSVFAPESRAHSIPPTYFPKETRMSIHTIFAPGYFFGLSSALLSVLMATQLQASPAQVISLNDPNHCDLLDIPFDVDEIGDFSVFPADEALEHETVGTWNPVCVAHNLPLVDPVVEITNLTGRDLTEVWYIADPETRISNWDGFAEDAAFGTTPQAERLAFRLDHDLSDPGGMHHPLVGEDKTLDGIWEAGEKWRFVLQDYDNLLGLPPDAISSIGVGSTSMPLAGFVDSSGSIVAIPEPASLAMLGLGLIPTLGIARRRRR